MSALPKIKKPSDLRENLFETLEQNANGQTFLIPHKKGNAVLVSEENHAALIEKVETLKAINQGLQDYLDGKVFSQAEVANFLKEKKSKWQKKK